MTKLSNNDFFDCDKPLSSKDFSIKCALNFSGGEMLSR